MIERDPLEVYNSTLVPMVVEQTARGERSFDILFTSFERAYYLSNR